MTNIKLVEGLYDNDFVQKYCCHQNVANIKWVENMADNDFIQKYYCHQKYDKC